MEYLLVTEQNESLPIRYMWLREIVGEPHGLVTYGNILECNMAWVAPSFSPEWRHYGVVVGIKFSDELDETKFILANTKFKMVKIVHANRLHFDIPRYLPDLN